ncbi:MAG: 16S rRNA (cytidine(1402)-2'-O)-methyltransferase [Candidatus Caenarcaniphilales bacterium]|nr:16S rRNA (cytidine(1402)-2'-O)-methyltransferase [Candidatus Caenarcaniphilales bacterium]
MQEIINALYIIASPIGNLGDLTERAKFIISEVDVIVCEDTRVTSKLLNHIGCKKKLISCNAHNESNKSKYLIELLKGGNSIGYLSDAGTPGISDPGNLLVEQVVEAGFEVIPIPGPSSITTILSICGFNLSKGFYFEGFLPRKDGKLKKLIQTIIVDLKVPLIAFESPYRIKKSLSKIAEFSPTLKCCLGRELTKLHEEIIRGNISEVAAKKITEKGEFVIVLSA